MNYADSERIQTVFNKAGYTKVHDPLLCDVIVILSCSVRQKAEEKVIGWINNIRKHIQEKTGHQPIIILTGCMVRRDYENNNSIKSTKYNTVLKRKLKNSIIVIDIRQISDIIRTIKCTKRGVGDNKFEIPHPYNRIIELPENYLSIPPTFSNNDIIAYIPISTGCNQFCTYCIVPFARGSEYCRPTTEILKDVKSALLKGKKIIILLGQIVDKWSYDSYKFYDLLSEILENNEDFWLSFLSSHPSYMDENVLRLIVENPKMLKFLGLPLQSGDNHVLKRMNRGYSFPDYLKIINKLKQINNEYPQKTVNDIYITTDIIVGFCDETKKEFENTYKNLKKVVPHRIFLAPYSNRPGSIADKMYNDNVSPQTKKSRFKKIKALSEKFYYNYNHKLINTKILVRPKNLKMGITISNQFIELSEVIQTDIGQVRTALILKGNKYGISGKIIR